MFVRGIWRQRDGKAHTPHSYGAPAALPGVPPSPPAAEAPRKSAGDRPTLMRLLALRLRRGRMRTPERGVRERGVMRAAGRMGPPPPAASRPEAAVRCCVRPTRYSGAGETCRGGR